MVHKSIQLPYLGAPGCAVFSVPDNSLWLGTEDGKIVTVRLLDGRVRLAGGGYGPPSAVLPMADGLGVLIVERSGKLRVAPRASAGAEHSTLVADLGRPLAGARLHPDGDAVIVLEASPMASLQRVDLATGAAEALVSNLEDPVALAVSAGGRQAMVLDQAAAGLRLVVVDVDTGAVDRSLVDWPAGA
jgi:hypothetical protein